MNINLRLTCLQLIVICSFANAQVNNSQVYKADTIKNSGKNYSDLPKGIQDEHPKDTLTDQSKQFHIEQQNDTLMEKPKSWISINLGVAYPLGMFGTKDRLGYGNYAERGYTGNISGGIPIIPIGKSKLGLALLVSYTFHPFDIETYKDNIAGADTTQARGSYQSAGGLTLYKETNLMAGLFYICPMKGSSFITFRALTGLMYCSFPEIIYQAAPNPLPPSASYNYYNEQWDIFSSISKTRVYDFGIEGQGSLSKNICLMLNVDLLFADPVYKTNMQYQFYGNANSAAPTTWSNKPIETSMPIRIFNFTMGVAIQFGK